MGVPRAAGPTLCCYLLLLRLCGAWPGDHCQSIDCTLQNRQRCASGSTECGPCIEGFTESHDGKCHKPSPKDLPGARRTMKTSLTTFTQYMCVLWSLGSGYPVYYKQHFYRHHMGKDTIPDLEQDIDNLALLLSGQDSRSIQLADAGNNATSSQSPPQPPPPPNVTPSGRNGQPSSTAGVPQERRRDQLGDGLLLGVVIACAVSALMALMVAGICWCRMRREKKLAAKADYPAFKSPSPPPYDKISPGDKKLAQNAQMYHYQHQKQQMLSMEKNKDEPKHTDSAVTSDEENEDGDFTVYECPGLAPVSTDTCRQSPEPSVSSQGQSTCAGILGY
uniref:Neural proliferation, differentiation and control 1 n=1 Tax=Leptobrachium leishanense TaxID=445787 RepID=A0A8C5QDL7_9ANUR